MNYHLYFDWLVGFVTATTTAVIGQMKRTATSQRPPPVILSTSFIAQDLPRKFRAKLILFYDHSILRNIHTI